VPAAPVLPLAKRCARWPSSSDALLQYRSGVRLPRRLGTFAIILAAPLFDLVARVVEREEHLFIETYMDPASAQGILSMGKIGCSHISGLLLG
jgi:hypothetical protein